LQEVLQTFVFTLVYLVLKYDAVLSKTDRILKGVCLCFIFLASLSMTRGSGGCLNPAIGLAQSTYMLGLLPAGTDVASKAKFMWVYILMPFLGATLAACLYFFHASVED
jgi:glycerol uptake facilitator-like aquaporin